MSSKAELLKYPDHERVSFVCPGCGNNHSLPVSRELATAVLKGQWHWNGSLESPTLMPSILMPSILMRTGHYAFGGEKPCWCDYNAERPNEKPPFECCICHSYVKDGRIQFLDDCSHELRGQTVDLPDME